MRITSVYIHRSPDHPSKGIICCGNWSAPCALGRNGIGLKMREGDGKTPVGQYTLLKPLYRPDRLRSRYLKMHGLPIQPHFWWCDLPHAQFYNQLITQKIQTVSSEEKLWRDDHLYDVVIPLSYNMYPAVNNKGSAIFIHIAKDGYSPTAGCIALSQKNMQQLLIRLRDKTIIIR